MNLNLEDATFEILVDQTVAMAMYVQGLGYPGEIGYQTFLYSSVKEWRKLLMFLIEKLPKENTQAADEPVGAGVMLGRMIAAELEQCLSSPWTPGFCKKDSVAWKGQEWWLEVRDIMAGGVGNGCCLQGMRK